MREADQLTASFSALPALNAGFFEALILMFSPVRVRYHARPLAGV